MVLVNSCIFENKQNKNYELSYRLKIAQSADIKHIREIADKISIDREDLEYFWEIQSENPFKIHQLEENIKEI